MIQLSDRFNYKRLLRFSFPSIVMVVFTSIYGVVDGFFVSNYAGKTPFAAVNFIMPVLMILGCIGFMLGTGGSAIISKKMGENDIKKANEIFSMLVYVSIIMGIILMVLGLISIRNVVILLGAEGRLLEDCVTYGRIILLAIPFFILQYEFQCLFVTAAKPGLGLFITIASGASNMMLDALFVAVFNWGLIGAATATAVSQLVGGILPLIYFGRKNTSMLRIKKFKWDFRALVKACTNGSSELMNNISMSIVSMLFNARLMKYAGEDGVASYGVLMYVSMVFQAVFIGYSVGTAPLISYNYGARNQDEVKGLLKKSVVIIGSFSVVMFASGEILSRPLSLIFVGYDKTLLKMTVHAFTIFSVSFLFSGLNIFGSSFFTALNDGFTSVLISFLRTMIFEIGAVIVLPIFFELDGIWCSVVAAEVMALIVTAAVLVIKRKKYNYYNV